MLKTLTILSGLLLISTGVAAQSAAQSVGPYASLTGGAAILSDDTITGTSISDALKSETGAMAGLAIGYGFDNSFRVEGELAHRWNDADTLGGSTASGDMSATSIMANGFYDFGLDGDITPYIGAGLGMANVEANGLSPVGSSILSDNDSVLAWQGIAGIAFQFSDALALTADYRYLTTDDLSLSTTAGTAVEQGYENHAFTIGLRFQFGSTSDPMPFSDGQGSGDGQADVQPVADTASMEANDTTPVATIADNAENAPDYARAYRVLFDLDKSALNAEALKTIDLAAISAKDNAVVMIEASGHADRSGSIKHNDELSKSRAEAVKAALIDTGIQADHITISWHGESKPLVETKDGVKNPQNRRVEIYFTAN